MNSWKIIWLIFELYFKKGLPNLEKIQKMGLLAVKIGQIHALRLDFLPAEKCKHLSRLYRNNVAIHDEKLNALIKLNGGEKFKNKFIFIDEKPLATASIGQVHRACLLNGEKVVVKFVKGKFKNNFIRDVKKVRKFFKLVIWVYPKLKKVGNPIGILGDIEEYTLKELDLRNEALGQDILKRLADKQKNKFDLSMLLFQKQFTELTNENVLVSQFIDAPSVDELLEKELFRYEDLLKLFYVQGFYIFVEGKFHGDIHPGNVLYDGKHFYFVDTAFIGKVGEKIRKGLFYFFEALSRYDYLECAKWLNSMAKKEINGKVYERFEKDFVELYKNYTGSTVSQVSLTKQMMLTIKLGVNAGMEFEKGIFSIIRSLMYLDGMVLRCNPKAVLIEDMRKFINDYRNML